MLRPTAPEAAWAAPSRLRRRTASVRLRTLRARPAVPHAPPRAALSLTAREHAARPPRWLVQSGMAPVLAYAVYTALNFTLPALPPFAGTAMLALAAVWFGAVLVSDLARWRHYDPFQRTRALLVWAAVLVLSLAV